MRVASLTVALALLALAFLCSACIRLPPHVARELEPAAAGESDHFRTAPGAQERTEQRPAP